MKKWGRIHKVAPFLNKRPCVSGGFRKTGVVLGGCAEDNDVRTLPLPGRLWVVTVTYWTLGFPLATVIDLHEVPTPSTKRIDLLLRAWPAACRDSECPNPAPHLPQAISPHLGGGQTWLSADVLCHAGIIRGWQSHPVSDGQSTE